MLRRLVLIDPRLCSARSNETPARVSPTRAWALDMRARHTRTDELARVKDLGQHRNVLAVVFEPRPRHGRLQALDRDAEPVAQLGQAVPSARLMVVSAHPQQLGWAGGY